MLLSLCSHTLDTSMSLTRCRASRSHSLLFIFYTASNLFWNQGFRSRDADWGSRMCAPDTTPTCFSLPLVKHGDMEVRILFHFSSLTVVIASSKRPAIIASCKHIITKFSTCGAASNISHMKQGRAGGFFLFRSLKVIVFFTQEVTELDFCAGIFSSLCCIIACSLTDVASFVASHCCMGHPRNV